MKKKELLLSHWQLNKNPLARLRVIQAAIKYGYPNVEKLAEQCQEKLELDTIPGDATIFRDLRILKEGWGYPIECDDFHKGYHYLNDKFEYALNKLNREQMPSQSSQNGSWTNGQRRSGAWRKMRGCFKPASPAIWPSASEEAYSALIASKLLVLAETVQLIAVGAFAGKDFVHRHLSYDVVYLPAAQVIVVGKGPGIRF